MKTEVRNRGLTILSIIINTAAAITDRIIDKIYMLQNLGISVFGCLTHDRVGKALLWLNNSLGCMIPGSFFTYELLSWYLMQSDRRNNLNNGKLNKGED